MSDYKTMYFQFVAKVSDAVETLLKAQQEGEAKFMEEEPSLRIEVIPIKEENLDSE